MHLIDGHRLRMHGLLAAVPHPIVVPPDVLALVDDRGGMRCGLGEARHGIGLEPPDAVGPQYLELVEAASAGSFDEQRPNSRSGHQLHVVPLAVPVIEVADEPHGLRVGCPDRESGAERFAPRSESSTVISWAPKRRQHSVSCPSWKPVRSQPVRPPLES